MIKSFMEVCSFTIKILKLFSAFNFSFFGQQKSGTVSATLTRYLQRWVDRHIFTCAGVGSVPRGRVSSSSFSDFSRIGLEK
jgi:hypothetical protein